MELIKEITEVKRRIFLQQARKLEESNSYRIASTETGHANIHEYTLAARELRWLRFSNAILIPVSGTLEVDHRLLNPGEALNIGGKDTEVVNPFNKELVNFLVVEFQGEVMPCRCMDNTDVPEPFHFDINSGLNSLVPVCPGLYLGKFEGRHDFSFRVAGPCSKTLIYVVEGAFEAAECLLEDRDALLIENAEEIDWEALSNNAILLVVESSL